MTDSTAAARQPGAPFRAVVMGEESLMIQCAETLREAGHDLVAVVTDAPEIHTWATAAEIPVLSNDSELAARLEPFTFDFLFSKVSLDVLD